MAYSNKIISNPKVGLHIQFLQTARETDGRLLEMLATYAPQSLQPPAHYHPQQTEDFEVLDGALTVKINGAIIVMKKGEKLHVPPHTIHSMWNQSDATTIVRWQVQPALQTEQLLKTMAGLAKDGKTDHKGVPSLFQVALTAKRFGNVFRLSNPPYTLQRILFALLSPLSYVLGYKAVYKKYLD